ncbi:MAG: cation diffusion facilitator family transporter [Candidatus Omnitrophica bacterium]|nr:cation diffusion facilitator family transporter [Candidatus Omnitrophota bacterium]
MITAPGIPGPLNKRWAMHQRESNSYRTGEKGAWTGIISNFALFLLKLFAGLAGGSQAMIADAFHTASDAFTSLGVLAGFIVAKQPADDHHPYGHGRAESISAKLISIVLIGVGVAIAYDSAQMLLAGELTEPGMIALIAAVISIIIKQIAYVRVRSMASSIRSVSLEADAYHHKSDVFSSLAALVGIAGARMGYHFMDPLAGIIVAGFIIKVGADLFHKAYDELMDAAPPEELRKKVERLAGGVEGVLEVKKVMSRKTGIEYFFEIIIGIDADLTVREGHDITHRVRRAVFDGCSNTHDVIVHAEPGEKQA